MGTRKQGKWTPQMDERLIALIQLHGPTRPGYTQAAADLSAEFGGIFTADAARVRGNVLASEGKFERPRIPPRGTAYVPPAHVAPVVTSAPAARIPQAEVWQAIERQTDADTARHLTERLIELRIDDTLPIAVSAVSDQHLRLSGPVMVRHAREDAELIARTPGHYAVLGGDGADNHVKIRAAMVGGGSKPADEWRAYDHYLGFFGADKILAMISGNHDDWTRDEAGVDMVALLAEKNRIHYCPDEARIGIQLGSLTYRFAIRHQYRFNSSLNITHVVKRWWDMGNDPFDIGVICHHHEPALEPFTRHGRTIWAARPGSYQVTSSYSRRYGFPLTKPTCPTFILFPDTFEVLGFLDVWAAANYLTWLRSDWPRNYMRRTA